MSMEWIRNYYGVPAQRGGRVKYTGRVGFTQLGTITSASGGHLNVRLDGQKHSTPFHPTWELAYLDKTESAGATVAILGDQGGNGS